MMSAAVTLCALVCGRCVECYIGHASESGLHNPCHDAAQSSIFLLGGSCRYVAACCIPLLRVLQGGDASGTMLHLECGLNLDTSTSLGRA